MGTKLKELVSPKPVSLESLSGKLLIVDAFNVLYQFLTTIRQPDGNPLKTSSGLITSHLLGLFNRTTKLTLAGIKLAFVFDGKPPELKQREREKRQHIKELAQEKYEIAKQAEDIDEMRKFAARTSRLDRQMIEDAKLMLRLLGIPIVQAPGEGEAQAAYMVANGQGYAVVSEDYDSLLFGVPRLIKGLSISRRRKQKDALAYTKTEIYMIELETFLNSLKLNQNQLIAMGMLIGTDFNRGGIKGIGPKKALKLVKTFGSDFNSLFAKAGWNTYFEYGWQEVFEIFKHMNHTEAYELKQQKPDSARLKELLVGRFEFSEASVSRRLEKLEKFVGPANQHSLGDYF